MYFLAKFKRKYETLVFEADCLEEAVAIAEDIASNVNDSVVTVTMLKSNRRLNNER